MVQVAPSVTIFDLTIRGLSPGTYHASIRERGDIVRGPESVGRIWESSSRQEEEKMGRKSLRSVLGTVEVNKGGVGAIFCDKPIEIWEVIGRSIIVSKQISAQGGKGPEGFNKQDANTLVGVIARSAGVWENDKTVCSCSGKTVWEERKEQTTQGML